MVNKMTPKISICIPTWEQNGYGAQYLSKLLETIKTQTFKDFEVVISDHSVSNVILDVVNQYSKLMSIVYVKNEEKLGNSPSNTNNAIKNSNGEIIKIIFQDDFFFSDDSLLKIFKQFTDPKVNWLVNGCNHTDSDNTSFNRFMVPRWNDLLYKGVNTISSPSVLTFRKNTKVFFDENLVMLMDCEIYYNFYKKYGLPTILPDTLITNRLHQNQISSNYKSNINDEINYVKNKYSIL